MSVRTSRGLLTIVALAAAFVGAGSLRLTSAQNVQARITHGQNIAPAYEGFEQNPDGTFTLVFGYLNRNYEEILNVPIGPDNNIEPGGPDRGQPTHFLPRRRRFEFRIQVPKDFGDKEIVWTLTCHGKTEKAYATLKPDYILDKRVEMMNASSFGQRGNEGDNQPPVVAVQGETRRTVKVGEPLELTAVITDDGLPAPPSENDRRTQSGGQQSNTAATSRNAKREFGVRAGWYVYRGAGSVSFEPKQTIRDYPLGSTPPPLAKDGRVSVKATFGEPGTYVVRAVADDMALQRSQDVTITVLP
jgi:hypothetical protein